MSILKYIFTAIAVCLIGANCYGFSDDYDIYLLIGQSNMAGRGSFEPEDTTKTIEGVWLLNSEGVPEKAKAPFNKYSSIRKDLKLQGYSPANNFSKLIHGRTGRKILLVVNAKGGSSIMSWQPQHKDGFLDEAVRRTRQAIPHGNLKGILWHQGETNVQKKTPDYAGKFKTMITALRDSLGHGDIPVVIGQLGQWEWAPEEDIRNFNDSVVPAICREVKNCNYVTSDGLGRLFKDKPQDPHFSRKAQIELGRRYADAMTPLVESAYITPYKYGKKSAISFTFDDGDLDHYLLAAPELEKRGFRGTFWIIGKKIDDGDSVRPRMSWSQLKEMSERGHEISNHSWSHGKLVLMSPEEARKNIEMNDSAIMRHVGQKPLTFCYPFNATRPWLIDIAEEGRVGTRMHQTGIGQQNNKSTPEKIKKWVDDVMEDGLWGVTMTHGITTGYDKWHTPKDLWDMFDYVKSHEDDIWVGTFKECAAYRTIRDNTVIKVYPKKYGFDITTEMNLDPGLFTAPVTICIKGDWKGKKIEAKRGGKKLATVVKGDSLLITVIPSADPIKCHVN